MTDRPVSICPLGDVSGDSLETFPYDPVLRVAILADSCQSTCQHLKAPTFLLVSACFASFG